MWGFFGFFFLFIKEIYKCIVFKVECKDFIFRHLIELSDLHAVLIETDSSAWNREKSVVGSV